MKNQWDAYPKLAQMRFCSYAPTSGDVIDNKQLLEELTLVKQGQFTRLKPLVKRIRA